MSINQNKKPGCLKLYSMVTKKTMIKIKRRRAGFTSAYILKFILKNRQELKWEPRGQTEIEPCRNACLLVPHGLPIFLPYTT